MAPRRPLPDLCIIQVVKMLLPNDQLTAARMSPRSAGLVRAANRRVKTLVMTRRLNDSDTINWTSGLPGYSFASSPSVQLLPPATTAKRPDHFPDQLLNTTRLSRWNYLLVGRHEDEQFFADEATIELIVTIFSAVTELQFACHSGSLGENLVALLERPRWARQLTSLKVLNFDHFPSGPGRGRSPPNEPLSRRLAAAINKLPALQCLSMAAYIGFPLLPPDLGRMTQLRVLAIYAWDDMSGDSPTAKASLRSLERYAADNVNNEEEDHHRLQVHLSGWPTERLLALSPALRRRIVRFDLCELSWADFDVPLLCRHFPSLNTLTLSVQAAPRPIRALFAALSSLPRLVHLALDMTRELTSFTTEEVVNVENELGLQQQQQTPVQLRSLRALDLELSITSSNLPQWLNLPAAMPQLQAIHLKQFYCGSRSTDLCYFLKKKTRLSSYLADLKFYQSTLPLLHPGIPHEQFILGEEEPYPTLEQLLSASW